MNIMVAFLGGKKRKEKSKVQNINSFSKSLALNKNNIQNNDVLKSSIYKNYNDISDTRYNNGNKRVKIIESMSSGRIYANVETREKNVSVKLQEIKNGCIISKNNNFNKQNNKQKKRNKNTYKKGYDYKNTNRNFISYKLNDKPYIFNVFKLLKFTCFAMPILIMFFINFKFPIKFFLNISTNFRLREKNNFQVSDLVKTYNLYNSNNYSVDSKKEEILKENVEKAVLTDEDIIDMQAEMDEIEVFFKNDNIKVEITENSPSIQRINVGSTKLLNYSSKRNINFEELLNLDVIFTKKSDKILLYNTHTSESYRNSEGYQFGYTGTMRTTDSKYNMLEISKKFNENLKKKGIESIHDTTPHDYGTYTSAYAKSRITVKNALSSMSGAGIIIDVHRDASSNLDFRPVVSIKGRQVAQLMFVVGVGSNSTPNENWKENLKLALKLQLLADKVYPGLFRPMIIRNSVYNQDLNKYSLLIEFGATGNTIEEVKLSTRCMTNLLNIMYKD